MKPPFLVLGLPRSRTAWLSRFLTYGGWSCGHDEIRRVRTLEDVKSWLSQPCTGTVETAAAPFWRLALDVRPDLRIVTVRRDPEEAAESAVRCGLGSDLDAMVKAMRRMDRKIGQIEKRVLGTRSFRFEDLAREDVCADLFAHCLPFDHDSAWWAYWSGVNVQINVPELVRYVTAHGVQLSRISAIAKQKGLQILSSRRVKDKPGLTIQVEPLADLLRDGQALFRQHTASAGEHPENFANKNYDLMQKFEDIGCLQVMVARSNGKVFGYLVTVMGPSLEAHDRLSACSTAFYASPDYPGLGLKLQRESARLLEEQGVYELAMRAGVRGDGPRISAMFRRMGAEPFGELYRLEFGRK